MNLAVVRLHRNNALDMAEARIALQRVILTSTTRPLQPGSTRTDQRRDAFNNFPQP